MNPDIPQKRAEQLFKKEKRAHDARNAMMKYEHQAVAVTREKDYASAGSFDWLKKPRIGL